MNCSNCGAYLPDGSAFCTNCGATLAAPAANPYAAPAANPYGYRAPRPAGAVKFAPDFSNKKSVFYLLAAGLALLGFIFSLMKVMNATVSLMGYTQEIGSISLGESEVSWAIILDVLCALASIAACVLLAMFKLPENLSKICKIAAPVGAFLAAMFFLVGFISAKSIVMTSYSDTLGGYDLGIYTSAVNDALKVKMTVMGVMAIIFLIGAAALALIAVLQEKKKAAPAAAYPPPYNPYG